MPEPEKSLAMEAGDNTDGGHPTLVQWQKVSVRAWKPQRRLVFLDFLCRLLPGVCVAILSARDGWIVPGFVYLAVCALVMWPTGCYRLKRKPLTLGPRDIVVGAPGVSRSIRYDAVQSAEVRYLSMPLSGQIILHGVGRQMLIGLDSFDHVQKNEIVALILERCSLVPQGMSRRLYVRAPAALKA